MIHPFISPAFCRCSACGGCGGRCWNGRAGAASGRCQWSRSRGGVAGPRGGDNQNGWVFLVEDKLRKKPLIVLMEKGQEFTSTDEHRGSRDRKTIYMSCMWVLRTLWKTTILLPKHGKTWYVSQKREVSRFQIHFLQLLSSSSHERKSKRAALTSRRRWPKSWTKLWTAPKWMFWFLNGWVAWWERLLRMGCFFWKSCKTVNQWCFRTPNWRDFLVKMVARGKDLDWRHPHRMRID